MEQKQNERIIDLTKVAHTLWTKRCLFYKVWAWTFVLSCIWIFPQPRYYTCEVELAPEMSGEDVGGGLSSIASSFGVNLGGLTSRDAIYPELYPELFESPEFVFGLYGIQIKTMGGKDEESLQTDYYTYIRKYQKKNWLLFPLNWIKSSVSSLISPKEPSSDNFADINPAMMSYSDYMLMNSVMEKISCTVDKKNSVITISVTDQDPLVCTFMADSVKAHLQDFIIRYRTSKAKEDLVHYQQMRDSAEIEYDKATEKYNGYCDSHMNTVLQTYQSDRDKLKNDMMLKQNTLTAMETQLQTSKVKLQEKTPAFTTLKSATAPVKPAGPKRMIFVAMMLVLSSVILSVWLTRKDIF
ncbi:chain-length determining protein [Prevotella sp. E9-3]|uniref:chain-length determining protein n=1 Tax=Prevotella sp. E9-3 TaxID=2913621 RepID=UPI001EDC579E|nr:chain-length determining protein [Prevotella sp. E9-3]UKK47951.1 chain-length determining protein [Prevotella sp. E9-3]